MQAFFDLAGQGTTVRRECFAGLATFLTMSYIIVANPLILADAGMDKGALITATILASACGCLLAGLVGRVPYAMAPGMGINAYFVQVCASREEVNWNIALGVVVLSGLLFLLLTLGGWRRHVAQAIPESIRLAIGAGIGFFLAFIGLQNAGLVVDSPATLVMMGALSPVALVALGGLALLLILEARRVRGSIVIGIVATTVVAMLLQWRGVAEMGIRWPESWASLGPRVASPAPIFLKLDLLGALRPSLIGVIFSFLFVDLFDSVGSIVACSYEAGRVRPDGTVEGVDRVLAADAGATILGGLFGTSTTTTFIESGAGIAAGGRSGLTAVVVGLCFLASLPLAPWVALVPMFAIAPALILVGIYMFRPVTKLDLSTIENAAPAFVTMAMIPLTYQINIGLAFGFVTYILVKLGAGKGRDISWMLWILGALSALELAQKAI